MLQVIAQKSPHGKLKLCLAKGCNWEGYIPLGRVGKKTLRPNISESVNELLELNNHKSNK